MTSLRAARLSRTGASRFSPATRRIPGAAATPLLSLLFAAALASLFTGIDYDTDFARIRPFEFLATLCILGTVSQLGLQRISIHRFLGFHLAFLTFYVFSAFTVGAGNGQRELIQVVVISSFVVSLAAYAPTVDMTRLLSAFSRLVLGIMFFNIVWHLDQGFYTGWKRLGDPVAIFLLLPAIVSARFATWRSKGYVSVIMILALTGVIILLSGERKAYIVAGVGIVAAGGLINARYLLIVPLIIVAIAILARLDPSGYLDSQLSSIYHPGTSGDLLSLTTSDRVESLSNVSRQLQFQLGWEAFESSPIIGIGTNAYESTVQVRLANLPAYLNSGLHGEFLRVLVENGVIGLSLYLAAWMVALRRLADSTNIFRLGRGLEGVDRTRVLLFAAVLVYCIFEASKTLSILAFMIAPIIDILMPKTPAGQEVKPPRNSRFTPA